jgi:hypothetical protein
MIFHDKENSDKLSKYKKKDDLCDAFLQGAYYINKTSNCAHILTNKN